MNASENVSEAGGFAPYRAWRWLTTPYEVLDQYADELGMTFRMTLPGMGRMLVTGDAGLIAETARNKSLVGGKGTQALRPILGDHSLIVIDGDQHRCHRRSIAPSFSADAAGRVDALTLEICRESIGELQAGSTFSVQEITRSISLRIIIRVLFGELGGDRERHLVSLVENLMGSFQQPAVLFIKALQWNFGRHSPWGRFVQNKANLRSFILQQVEERKTLSDPGDALIDQLIAKQRGGQFNEPDEAIFEELMSLLLFGHDTAAATMAWAFHHVHENPEVCRQLRDEAKNHDAPGPLFAACIKESQRLCPVVVHVTRVATETTRLGNHEIRRGESVLPCMYLAQRNEANFQDPTVFSPQRFLQKGRVAAWTNFPFGFGNRKCIGATFAMRQMELILFAFMRHSLLQAAAAVTPVREMLLIVPRGGTRMRMTEHLT